MAYASWSVVFGEQPSAAKWNILGTNDASFNDGTGIDDGAITPAKRSGGYATGTVSMASSGNLATTGLGFEPKIVMFFDTLTSASGQSSMMQGFGMKGPAMWCTATTTATGTGAASTTEATNRCILRIGSGGATVFSASYISSDADGFTINVANTSATTVRYLAMG